MSYQYSFCTDTKSCSKIFYLPMNLTKFNEPLREAKWNSEFQYSINKDHHVYEC